MLAGVCAGLAEYLNVDVTLVRLAFILITLAGGAGLLAYIVAAIVMPDQGQVGGYRPPNSREPADTSFARPTEPAATTSVEVNDGEWKKMDEGRFQEPPRQQPRPEATRGGTQRILGLILIGVGGYMLINRFVNLHYLMRRWWPLLVVLLGVALLSNSFIHKQG
jgi:phage shock protein C